ncbi:MAG: dienelactone hydrolase family protein [Dokdonella sp.]
MSIDTKLRGHEIRIDGGGMHCIGAWLAEPIGKPRGGIVVAQEIFGVNAHIRSVVERFAALGYVAIAPAFFDHVENDVELDYDRAGIAAGKKLVTELGLDRTVADVASAAASIASAGKIGFVGYCWGGTVAYLAAARLAMPSVSYYGMRNVHYFDEAPQAPMQFHFGENDKSIPPDMIERHRRELANAEVFTYPADHGFNCDARAAYDAASASLALHRTLEFFERELG